jgi:hypothetical protein
LPTNQIFYQNLLAILTAEGFNDDFLDATFIASSNRCYFFKQQELTDLRQLKRLAWF